MSIISIKYHIRVKSLIHSVYTLAITLILLDHEWFSYSSKFFQKKSSESLELIEKRWYYRQLNKFVIININIWLIHQFMILYYINAALIDMPIYNAIMLYILLPQNCNIFLYNYLYWWSNLDDNIEFTILLKIEYYWILNAYTSMKLIHYKLVLYYQYYIISYSLIT